MELLEIIKGRRSIRRYQSREVAQEDVQRLLEAIQWSPSWANTQCWEVIVVRDHATREQLQETMAKGNPATKSITEAPLLLVFCARLQSSGYYKGEVTTKFGDWFMYDLGIATQSLCLMAHSLGLGTVIAGLFDHQRVAELLNVPDGYEVVTMVPVGYPAKESKPPERRRIAEFTHQERF
ncbi:MAG: nitroreductase family protein [Syntrophobacteria bacterium]